MMTENEIIKSYEFMAHQIEREDGLINTRITWMLTFEGFLFAALAIVAGQDNDPSIQFVLKYALPVVGSIIAFLAYLSIQAALSALKELKDRWDPTLYQNYPRPFGKEKEHAFASTYSKGLAIVIFVMWMAILLFFLHSDLVKSCHRHPIPTQAQNSSTTPIEHP